MSDGEKTIIEMIESGAEPRLIWNAILRVQTRQDKKISSLEDELEATKAKVRKNTRVLAPFIWLGTIIIGALSLSLTERFTGLFSKLLSGGE